MVELIFGPEGDRFQMFSTQHGIALVCILFVLIIIGFCRNLLKKNPWNVAFRYILAGTLLMLHILLQIWYIRTGNWSFAESLPLQLSTVALLLSAVLCWTRSYLLYEFIYFAGIGSALHALITPVLDVAFPHFWYYYFFVGHGGIVITAWFFTVVEQYQPTIKSIGRTILWLNALLIMIIPVNLVTGGNYMFLARKPSTPSLLNVLGPWPWYILWLEVIAIVLCFLLFLPFVLLKVLRRTPSRTS